MLDKASGLAADELVIDLEDAVAPAAKDAARESLVARLREVPVLGPTPAVRVNRPGTRWCHLDIEALAGVEVGLASIVLPKVEGGRDLAFADLLLTGAEAAAERTSPPLRLQALIETAAGLARIDEIAAGSERLDALVIGYADLAADLGRRGGTGQLETWLGVQERVLVAARANGLQAIDGPYFEIGDEGGLGAFAQATAAAGFDGKWAIHPSQIAPITKAFTPSAEEAASARRVLAALDRAQGEDAAGAMALDGKMIDAAMAAAARRLLARLPVAD